MITALEAVLPHHHPKYGNKIDSSKDHLVLFSRPLQFQPLPSHCCTTPCVLEDMTNEDSPSGPIQLLLFSVDNFIFQAQKKSHQMLSVKL